VIQRLVIFVTTYAAWLLLVFPYDRSRAAAGLDAWDIQSVLIGLAAALLCAAVTPGNVASQHSAKMLDPRRWFWFLVYVPILAWYVIKANLHVAYLVLHPDLPIKPGIVKVRTSLTSAAAQMALANSITLTPGTFTIDIDGEGGVLYVHWLDVQSEDEEAATKEIASRFEPILKRIFE